jgi:hypothetical protein
MDSWLGFAETENNGHRTYGPEGRPRCSQARQPGRRRARQPERRQARQPGSQPAGGWTLSEGTGTVRLRCGSE